MAARIITSPVKIEASSIPINKFLIEKIRSYGEQICLIESENDKSFTFNQLLNDSLKVAAALKKAQLKPGEIFMIYGFNCYEFLVAIISGLLVGGTALPIRGADTS
ncbi:hypothetical protein B4U80_14201, partial [Leptotrombidium deliense]